jgi:hypothetical protein
VKLLKIDRAAVLAALLAGAAGAALLAPEAARAGAPNATWTGGSPTDTWSSGGNWSGGGAPGGSVGVLSLPPAGRDCSSWDCGFGVDDIASLTAGTLRIDASGNYLVTPEDSTDAITLSGGLSFASDAAPASSRLLTKMVVPLTLGGAQAWTLTGAAGTPTELALGAVTGESYPLRVKMSGGVTLQAAELDTGLLTLSGGGVVVIADQMAQPADGVTVFPPPLIGSQGVSLTNGAALEFTSPNAVSGPITIAPGSYSTLQIGRGVAPDGTATVDGNVTLRSNSTLQMWIDQAAVAAAAANTHRRAAPPVPQPSTDASQLTVFGELSLNNADLALSQGFTDTQVDCSALAPGQVYTLVAATQLLGSFDNIANGQVIPLGVCNPLGGGPSYAVIISYNTSAKPQTITATIVGPAQIKVLVARTLSVPAGSTLKNVLAAAGYTPTFDAPTAGTLSLSWTAVSHGRRVTVAAGSNLAGQVGPRRVAVRLTKAGRRLLFAADNPPRPKPKKIKTKGKGKKKHRKQKPLPRPKPRPVSITETANFTPNGQSTVTLSRQFTLR